MNQNRGMLYLNDPMHAAPGFACGDTKGLVFHENESFLSQAQTALWKMRMHCSWICVAAEGNAADIALALAAQLPVDRLALLHPPQKRSGLGGQMGWLRRFARRNLALVTSEILLVDAGREHINAILRGTRHAKLCVLDHLPVSACTQPWERLCENNLLIPWNRV